MKVNELGKVELTITLEATLYEELDRAATALGQPGVAREAIIFYLAHMGFTQLSDFTGRFKYMDEQRACNEAGRSGQ
jgi:hypothetical protein